MRETRQSGSEGGGAKLIVSPYPYLKRVRAWFRLKLMNHTRLKAGGIQRVSTRSR